MGPDRGKEDALFYLALYYCCWYSTAFGVWNLASSTWAQATLVFFLEVTGDLASVLNMLQQCKIFWSGELRRAQIRLI